TLDNAVIAESLKRGKAQLRETRDEQAGRAHKPKPWHDTRRDRADESRPQDFRPHGNSRPAQNEGDRPMPVSANRLQPLQIADAVAREKAIDRGIVIAAMEDAIQKAARSRYGSETEVRAEINPKTGEMRLSRLMLVVDTVENDSTQISVEDAKKRNPAAQVGDYISEALPPL